MRVISDEIKDSYIKIHFDDRDDEHSIRHVTLRVIKDQVNGNPIVTINSEAPISVVKDGEFNIGIEVSY